MPAIFHVDSFVSARLGIVYHCIPKTLSRSMLAYLTDLDPTGFRAGERNAGKEILDPALWAVPSPGDEHGPWPQSFSFTRNPYSRIVAVYYNKFVNYLDTPGQRAIFANYERLHPGMTFSEFVDWLATDEGSDARADFHFLPQYYFLLDADGRPAVDYLGSVEHAGEDLAELQGLLGWDARPLPRRNANADGALQSFDTSTRWQEVLDDRSIRILTSRYDGDFELLGYERLPYTVRPLFPRREYADLTTPAAAGMRRGRLRRWVQRVLAAMGVELRRKHSKPDPAVRAK